MKLFLPLALVVLTLAPARAQIFRPQAVNAALIGGLAGAIIGHNSGTLHHNAWRGAAIGAGAGLLIGSAFEDARDDRSWRENRGWRDDRGWRGGRASDSGLYVYRHPSVFHHGHQHRGDGHGYYHTRPDYRTSGVFLGGLSGAIIGHNSRGLHHNPWRGAAWGAGLGYLFGSLAEHNARARTVIEESPALVSSVPAPTVQPQQVTIINNYYGSTATPMTSANGLFGRN